MSNVVQAVKDTIQKTILIATDKLITPRTELAVK